MKAILLILLTFLVSQGAVAAEGRDVVRAYEDAVEEMKEAKDEINDLLRKHGLSRKLSYSHFYVGLSKNVFKLQGQNVACQFYIGELTCASLSSNRVLYKAEENYKDEWIVEVDRL